MIDRSTIDRIMAAADIVEVVSDFVSLRRAGSSYKGLCPFHDDKTPSFVVTPSKQLCKCFSCGGGGNVVKFLMQHEQLTYPEALKWLGKKYGIEVREKEMSAEQKQAATTREAMFVMNEWARDYFVDTLHNTVDGTAIGMSYFRGRGLRDDVIKKFQLGYSPEQRTALVVKAKEKGFEEKYIETTGLAFRTDDGKLLDRYHGRVIFPVHTISGRVVAFGGRILNSENKKVGKYVNSPESEIYSKRRELYGLYIAKQSIVKHDRCYLVEGYLDVISMHQGGIENVVASSGTALTNEQIRLIHRFTKNVTVLYDGDEAGIHASLRGIDLLLSEGMNIKVLLLPNGEDPDSFAQSHSPAEFLDYIETHQTDFIKFKTELLMKGVENDPSMRAEVIRDVVSSIALIPSDIVRQVYIHELAGRIGMDEAVIVAEVAQVIRQRKSEPTKKQSVESASHLSSISSVGTVASTPTTSDAMPMPSVTKEEKKQPNTDNNGATPASTKPLIIGGTPLTASFSSAHQKLEAYERQLVEMVVKHAEKPILRNKTEGEEEINAEVGPIVVEYIANELNEDGIELRNEVCRMIFAEALQQVQDKAFRARDYFMFHSNPVISKLATELSEERYFLSTEQQRKFVPEERRLEEIVPRAVMDYKHAILCMQREEINQQLRNPSVLADVDRVNELFKQLVEINQLEVAFAKVLGDRVIGH